MTTRGRLVLTAVGLGFIASVLMSRAALFVRPWFFGVLVMTGLLILVAAWRTSPLLTRAGATWLILPLAAGLTLTPAVAGRVSQGAAGTATFSARIGDGANPLLQGRGGTVTLLQILLAEQQAGGVYLAGRNVTVVAIAAGPHLLRRAAIVCCAADARTIDLPESGPRLPRPGTWVQVSGHLSVDGQHTTLAARTVKPAKTPDDPFL